jgi:hypothetical protein
MVKRWWAIGLISVAFLGANHGIAFYDDVCFTQQGAVQNCLANATPNCSITGNCVPTSCGADNASETNSSCLVPVNNSFSNGSAPNARSTIHADSIYLIAQAVGIDPRAAYFIAAYGDAPDHGQFEMMVPATAGDYQGTYVPYTDTSHATIAVTNLLRTSVLGTGIHFPLVMGLASVPATPDPTDSVHEGVSHLRNWVFSSGSGRPCLGGLTTENSSNSSYFSGSACYVSSSSYSFESGKYNVNQAANVVLSGGGSYQSGDQPFDGASPEGVYSTDSPTFAGDLQGLLNTSTGRLSDGKTPVPVVLLAMGVYLHSLLDRVSHAMALVPTTVSGTSNDLAFDTGISFPFSHAYLHFEEVGIGTLAGRTAVALNLAYSELSAWANQQLALLRAFPVVYAGNVLLVNPNATITSQSDIVNALVTQILNQPSAATRLSNFATKANTYGYAPLTQPK